MPSSLRGAAGRPLPTDILETPSNPPPLIEFELPKLWVLPIEPLRVTFRVIGVMGLSP
jgi:hypothetical protein